MKVSLYLPKYPNLPRHIKKSCKFTEEQILSIPILNKEGKSNGEISKIIGCSKELVRFYLMSPSERKERRIRQYKSEKARGKIQNKNRTGIMKELYHRRKSVLKSKYNEYAKVIRRRQYYLNPNLKPYILRMNKNKRDKKDSK